MPRSKKTSGGNYQGLQLEELERQYLAALRSERDQLDQRIKAIEGILPSAGRSIAKAPAVAISASATGKSAATTGDSARKPRNYDQLKSKITGPMTIVEILKALGMKPKQEGTLRASMQNYPGLFKSDGKRPATYTLDASR